MGVFLWARYPCTGLSCRLHIGATTRRVHIDTGFFFLLFFIIPRLNVLWTVSNLVKTDQLPYYAPFATGVRFHFIIVMIRWTGLRPWEFEFPFPGSLTSTFLHFADVDRKEGWCFYRELSQISEFSLFSLQVTVLSEQTGHLEVSVLQGSRDPLRGRTRLRYTSQM